ncbi:MULTISPECIES: DUF5789 family protein [Halobacterium]|uniref:Protein VNG_0358C n=5 Tax=Halobacterium salinarum TaxID=2242 RepID=P358_HALSA|nr:MULTISPECIES: DUF5789 family protein [Halobacterium]P84699.1 RecName: Full=Protein VNG_0358C [Halobacterium salinarum NRC-1]MBB6089755.1 hypothetical protein [Halobacterium salinarum]MCF2164154.1 hypothetical protein [Halobacterium salinarum]MCF2167770.1 hypothetical protein [Halobacterium salinarum]MCF2206832.1 hypothetical protein [Halobacterium salinarum]MCF2239000.1 hypothetical protein [Halobacterium salinarum]
MSDDNDEDAPAVELGEGARVAGAPIARVASRLTWALQKSEVVRKEGDTVVRTPDGPRDLDAVLEDVSTPYFETRREFERDVRAAMGAGPVPTE